MSCHHRHPHPVANSSSDTLLSEELGILHWRPSSTLTVIRHSSPPFLRLRGSFSLVSLCPAPHRTSLTIAAITTVGYGEITPRSFLGRLVTLPLLICGLLLVALPSFVLGREFSIVWEKMAESQGFPDDNDLDSPTVSRYRSAISAKGKDLTNLKLAQNQTELSKQIDALTSTVELQGKMIERLLNVLDKGKERDQDR